MTSALRNRTYTFRQSTYSLYHTAVERSIQFMLTHYDGKLTVEELAEAAFMSRFHFFRVFSAITGISPARYLAAIRIQEAKRLLLKTNKSVTDISLDVGYTSIGSFTRIFNDFVGFSPTHFRTLSRSLLSIQLEEVIRFVPCNSVKKIDPTIFGEIIYDGDLSLVGVAIFSQGIPRSQPIECVCLTGSREFSFYQTPPSGARLFAVGVLPNTQMEDVILTNQNQVQVGAVSFSMQEIKGPWQIRLRPRSVVEPPVVIAFPLLIAKSLVVALMSK